MLKDQHFTTCGPIMGHVWNQHKRQLDKNALIAENCISCLYMCMQNKMRSLYVIMINAHENLYKNVIFNCLVLLNKFLSLNVSFTKMLVRSYVTKARNCCLRLSHPKILIPTQIQKYKQYIWIPQKSIEFDQKIIKIYYIRKVKDYLIIQKTNP